MQVFSKVLLASALAQTADGIIFKKQTALNSKDTKKSKVSFKDALASKKKVRSMRRGAMIKKMWKQPTGSTHEDPATGSTHEEPADGSHHEDPATGSHHEDPAGSMHGDHEDPELPPPDEDPEAHMQHMRDVAMGAGPEDHVPPMDAATAMDVCHHAFMTCQATECAATDGAPTTATCPQMADGHVPKTVALECPKIKALIEAGLLDPEHMPEEGLTEHDYMHGCMGAMTGQEPPVEEVPHDSDPQAICRGMWTMCHSMELPDVVADAATERSEAFVTHDTAVNRCPAIVSLISEGLLTPEMIPSPNLYESDYMGGCTHFMEEQIADATTEEIHEDFGPDAAGPPPQGPAGIAPNTTAPGTGGKGAGKGAGSEPQPAAVLAHKKMTEPSPSDIFALTIEDGCQAIFDMCFLSTPHTGSEPPMTLVAAKSKTVKKQDPAVTEGGSDYHHDPASPAMGDAIPPELFEASDSADLCMGVHRIMDAAHAHEGAPPPTEPVTRDDFVHGCAGFLHGHLHTEETYMHEEHEEAMDACHQCHDECHAPTHECHDNVQATVECSTCESCHYSFVPGLACSSPMSSGSPECHDACHDSVDCTSCRAKHDSCVTPAFEQCYSSCDAVCPTHEQHLMGNEEELEDECNQCMQHAAGEADCLDICAVSREHHEHDHPLDMAPETMGSMPEPLTITPPEGVTPLPQEPASGKGKGKGAA